MDEATMTTADPAAAGDPDEVCQRGTFSFYEADALRLKRLCDRFGKDKSEIFRLGLSAIEGNMRILRHATAQPVNALKILAHLVRVKMPDAEGREIADGMLDSVAQLEAMLAPLDPEQPGA